MYDKPLAVLVLLTLLVGLVVGAGIYAIAFYLPFFSIGPIKSVYYYLGEGRMLLWLLFCGPILAIVGGLLAAWIAFNRLITD